MHGQRPSTRRKLTPKKPLWKITKKRKTHQSRQPREDILTENQQAWARSLTLSLSGWRNRQKFYKAHMEAQPQAEAQPIVTETKLFAESLPEDEAEDEAEDESEEEDESAMQGISQAEAEEEKAEAWAHKARAMHLAGRGVRKEKHKYFGWDPEGEQYLRNFALENIIAERRAKRVAERKAQFKADNGYSEDELSADYDDSNSDSSDDFQFSSPDGSNDSPVRPTLVAARAAVVDWREKARIGVIKKKLSVTKEWSTVTWNQKSNILERILVLEDDGYDIQALLEGKATSEQITSIILDRAAVKHQHRPQTDRTQAQIDPSKSPQGKQEELSPTWLDPALRDLAADSPDQVSTPNSQSLLSTVSPPGSMKAQGSHIGTVNDNTQPFSSNWPYIPQASRRLKRKCETGAEPDLEEESIRSSPAYKKRKIDLVAEEELAAQALQDIKQAVIRALYRSARSEGRKPLPSARIVFTAEIQSGGCDIIGYQGSTGSLRYLYPGSSKAKTKKTSYSISTCGLENTMAEIRFLTDTSDQESAIKIYDPEVDDDLTTNPREQEEVVQGDGPETQRDASRVLITTDKGGQISFQGDAIILAELLKTLGERELLHCVEWEWDGLRLQRTDELSWYLSPQTHDMFAGIENRIRRRSRTGSVEIVVHRVVM